MSDHCCCMHCDGPPSDCLVCALQDQCKELALEVKIREEDRNALQAKLAALEDALTALDDEGVISAYIEALRERSAALSKLDRLTAAVRAVYYAARWESAELPPDEEDELWTRLRDAAGFEPGHSP